MNHERLGIANICQMRQQLHRIDESFAGFQSAFDAKADQSPETTLQILRGNLMVRIVGQPG